MFFSVLYHCKQNMFEGLDCEWHISPFADFLIIYNNLWLGLQLMIIFIIG